MWDSRGVDDNAIITLVLPELAQILPTHLLFLAVGLLLGYFFEDVFNWVRSQFRERKKEGTK